MAKFGLQQEIEQSKPFSSRETEAFLNLQRTEAVLSESAEEVLRREGLTLTLYNVLRILRGSKEPLPCSTVSRRMLTRVPDLTRIVDRLVKKGYVRRVRSKRDRRVVLLSPTAKGLAVMDAVDGPLEEAIRTGMSNLSQSELRTLIGLLEKARSGGGSG